jgi:hypothetical protein
MSSIAHQAVSGQSRGSLLQMGLFGGGAAALLAVGGITTAAGTVFAAGTAPAQTQSTSYGCAEFGELVAVVIQIGLPGRSGCLCVRPIPSGAG